jgi:hypothetical protein
MSANSGYEGDEKEYFHSPTDGAAFISSVLLEVSRTDKRAPESRM